MIVQPVQDEHAYLVREAAHRGRRGGAQHGREPGAGADQAGQRLRIDRLTLAEPGQAVATEVYTRLHRAAIGGDGLAWCSLVKTSVASWATTPAIVSAARPWA